MLLVTLLGLAIIWRILDLIPVIWFSCGETVRYWQGEAPYGPTLIGMMGLTFTAGLCVWFVDLIRVRARRVSLWLVSVQGLLFLGIFIVLTSWTSFTLPNTPFTPVSQGLRHAFHSIPGFQYYIVYLEDFSEEVWLTPPPPYDLSLEKLPPETDLTLTLMGSRSESECSCMSKADQQRRDMLHDLDYEVGSGRITVEDANIIRLETPKPVEPQWCEATMDIARRRY